MTTTRAAMKESRALRAELRARDQEHRASVTRNDLTRIDNAEAIINRMPQARALREAACQYGALNKSVPLDADDSAVREANRALLDAAVHFVRALRGEE